MDRDLLLLCTQNALLGEVRPDLRAVTVDYDKKKKLIVYFYYDCEIDDTVQDLSSCIVTEISADFPPDELDSIDGDYVEWKYPKTIPFTGTLAYLRKEPHIQAFDRERTTLRPDWSLPALIVLAMQRALLGRITPELRLVSFVLDKEKKMITYLFFYEGEISKENSDLASLAVSEVSRIFPDYNHELQLQRIDPPQEIHYTTFPDSHPRYGDSRKVYERKEK